MDTETIAALIVKTVQLKITVREKEYLERKREELSREFPGMAFSDTAICRHLIHAGLGMIPSRAGEKNA